MNILIPVAVSTLTSSTIAEPDTGEAAWTSAGTYALGDQVVLTATHRIYECIQAHSGRTASPSADPLYWQDVGPTNRWAPFDSYVSTAATATTSASWVLSPGFFDALALYGLAGTQLDIEVLDGPGGAELYADTVDLYEPALGLYEYLFGQIRQRDRIVVTGIPLHPTAQLTLTVSGGTGDKVALGMLAIGQFRKLAPSESWGGTQAGASVEPVTYSRISTDEFGTTTIVRRTAATGMRAEVVMPIADCNYALRLVQQVLDVPVAWIASTEDRLAGLNVFGLGSASLAYVDGATARMSLTIKGLI